VRAPAQVYVYIYIRVYVHTPQRRRPAVVLDALHGPHAPPATLPPAATVDVTARSSSCSRPRRESLKLAA
jgi:hypothetical protein